MIYTRIYIPSFSYHARLANPDIGLVKLTTYTPATTISLSQVHHNHHDEEDTPDRRKAFERVVTEHAASNRWRLPLTFQWCDDHLNYSK